jgi:acetyl/propionyl-CoA carboxylase alpha subunit
VTEGDEISVHYDPMIAKLIATGATRDAARRRVLAALRAYPILGIHTNLPFLIRLLEHPRFVSGDIDTGLIDSERRALVEGLDAPPPPAVLALANEIRNGVGGHLKRTVLDSVPDPWESLRGWRT